MIRKWNTTWKCLWWKKWRPNGKTLFYYSHVFVISPNQISVPIPFTLMRGRQREKLTMRILLAKTPFPSGEPGKQQQPGISWRSYSSSVCMNGRTVCWLEVLVFRFFLLLNNQIIYTGLVFSDRMARLGLLVTFSVLILVAFACGELIHGPLAPPGPFQFLENQTY